MRAVLTSIAFAAGALTAWMMLAAAADLRAQGERSGALPVCAGAGGVLRVTTPSGSCEPGQKRLTFFVTGPASSAASAETEALERALRDVERQVADLERLAGRDNPSTVTAPFNVEDRSGRVVFSVANGEYSATYVNV